MTRHLLTWIDWQPAEVEDLLVLADRVRSRPADFGQALSGRLLGLLFLKASTRTRLSFERGVRQLGGDGVFLSAADLQVSRGETMADTARALSIYLDLIMARLGAQSDLEELARHSAVPVINGLTDDSHPCQALADLLTLRDEWQDLRGRKVAYVGDGNNVAHSLIVVAAKVGLSVSLACPEGYRVDRRYLAAAQRQAASTGAVIEEVADARAAVAGASAVYTDTWVSMGQDSERESRLAALSGFAVDAKLMAHAEPGAVFLHCLPCHRGEEVTAEVVDGDRSRVWRQAENRLHAQKAIMLRLAGVS